MDNAGRIQTSSKPLHDDGELDLTFDEWHQAWQRLLELIKTFLPDDFHAWEVHYTEIHKRTTHFPINPSVSSLSIWNDLEARHMAKKVLDMVQLDLKKTVRMF